MKLLQLLFFILIASISFGRPVPEKQTQEIFNDIYRNSTLGHTPSASIDVTLTSTEVSTSEALVEMTEGDTTDFSVDNISDAAYTDLITLSNANREMGIVNNSGGEFILRVDSTDVGYIAPGQTGNVKFSQSAGAVVRIKSVSGTVSEGKLYLNFFN